MDVYTQISILGTCVVDCTDDNKITQNITAKAHSGIAINTSYKSCDNNTYYNTFEQVNLESQHFINALIINIIVSCFHSCLTFYCTCFLLLKNY